MASKLHDFPTIIAKLSKRELADCVVCAIDDRYGYDAVTEDRSSIPRTFRLVHIIFLTKGFLNNSGLSGLLRLPCKKTFPTYLQELGYPSLGRELQRYVRWNFFYSLANVGELEQELSRQSDEISDFLGDYITKHVSEFEPLLPQIHQTLTYLEHFDPEGYEQKLDEPDLYVELLQTLTEGLRAGVVTLDDMREFAKKLDEPDDAPP